MRAANSAPYAIGAGTVASIPQAVSQVGVTSARNIAAAMGIYDALRIGDESAFNPIRCWQHSLAAGALCEQLYGEDADLPPGIPYLVGLCHDVGEIVLQTCFGPEFTQVLSAAARLDKPIGQIESAMLGVTHGELAQLAFELMGLPDSIRRPIQTMHDRASTTTRTRLGSAVRLADMYANGLLLSSSGRELIVAVTQAECRATTGQPHPAVPDGERFRAEMFALTTMLARLSPADEEKFTKPYYARTKHPVCLVRDPGLSRFDPITAAAMALADTTVMEKLPDRPMAGGLLIVVTGAADASGFSAEAIAKVADPARTLWLTRRSDAAAANPPALAEAPIQPVNMPVPIEALAAFIRKGAAAADTARQAAA
jgi:hypothetical protein